MSNRILSVAMCFLTILPLVLAGCLSDEEPVPKYNYGNSVERPDGEKEEQWTYEEMQANAAAIAFAKKDLNGDGSWNVEELHQALMAEASPEWARRTFEIMDKNGDGKLSREEESNRSSDVWFMLIDGNEDGAVSEIEYSRFNSWLVKTGHSGTIVRLMDRDGDGSLSLDEFSDKPPEVEFYKRDSNGDSMLSPAEFLSRCKTEEQLIANTKVFQAKDFDGDGELSVEEYSTSPKQRQFRTFDCDGDGALSLAEYGALDEVAASEAYAERLFQVRDVNGDGKLDMDELHAGSPAIEFAKKDLNGDGGWNADEFRLSDMPDASPEWAARTFEIMDRNGDGKMDLAERRNRAWFMFIDADEDGNMTEAEYGGFNPWLVEIGHCKTILDLMDKDDDGTVSLAEYDSKPPEVEFYKKDRSSDSVLSLEEFLASSNGDERIAADTKRFHAKDFDGDGAMSVEEYLLSPVEGRFRKIDSDQDGTLSLAEYGALEEVATSQASAKRVFKARDANGDGRLSLDEFRANSTSIEFARQDTDGDGQLTAQEYVAGKPDDAAALERDVFRLRDGDEDERLSLAEFRSTSRAVDFRRNDRDGDGGLDLSEYRQADMAEASAEWVERTFRIMDQDGDDRISMSELHKRSSEGWFAWMDANLDGILSGEEFAAKNGSFVETGRLEPLLVLMDVNGDGDVSEEEYCTPSEEVNFVRRDSNGDGKLGFDEYSVWTSTPAEAEEARSELDRRDLDKDDCLSFRELSIGPQNADFWLFDQDDDAKLGFEEFRLSDDRSEASPRPEQEGGNKQTDQTTRPRDRKAWQTFFNSVDANHDGQIAVDEFLRQPRHWRFRRLDVDDDGVITAAGFAQAPEIPDLADRTAAFIAQRDADKDEKLTVEEFVGTVE